MIETSKEPRMRVASPMLAGLTYAFVLMGLAAVVAALIMLATSQQEAELPVYAYVIHVVSLLIGGYVAGKRAGRKGWYFGGTLGIIYAVIVWLVGFLTYDRGLNAQDALFLAVAFVVGAIGGVFGVNASGRK